MLHMLGIIAVTQEKKIPKLSSYNSLGSRSHGIKFILRTSQKLKPGSVLTDRNLIRRIVTKKAEERSKFGSELSLEPCSFLVFRKDFGILIAQLTSAQIYCPFILIEIGALAPTK